jgi:DNA-directed RNA polymerase specialized sigma24 family protein
MRAQAIQDAIDAVNAIQDPTERAKVTTEALDIVHKGNGTLSASRREAVLELRAQGKSLRAIAAILGLFHSRVQQIISGEPTGVGVPGRKPKKADPGNAED